MYLEFYGLSEKPFSQTPDPRFLYWNDGYRETLASLTYGIRERKGFLTMIGEAGTGKTTLLRKLLDDLGSEVLSVLLFNPNATFEEILEYTLSELGITVPSGRKLAMLQRLNEFLLAAFAEGRNTILLIDEAQDLDSDVLESLRLLSNLETSQEKILQIVLSGQPELAARLAEPGLRQLKQRIAVRCRLEPLRREELAQYVGARLAVAGGGPELFAPETLDPIWSFAQGIPRLVNMVCDNALLVGYALGRRPIDREVIDEVVGDLRRLDVDFGAPALAPPAAAPPVAPTVAPAAPVPPASTAAAPAPEEATRVAAAPEEATRVAAAPSPPVAPDPRAEPSRRPSERPSVLVGEPPKSRRGLRWLGAAAAAILLVALGGALALWAQRSMQAEAVLPNLDKELLGDARGAAAAPKPRAPEAPTEPSSGAPAAATKPAASDDAGGDRATTSAEPATRSEAAVASVADEKPERPAAASAPEPVAPRSEDAPERVATEEAAPPADAPAPERARPAADSPPPSSAAPEPEVERAAETQVAVAKPQLEPADDGRAREVAEPISGGAGEAPPDQPAAEAPSARTPMETEVASARDVREASVSGARSATLGSGAESAKLFEVRPGDTLSNLATRAYGSANYTTLDMLRSRNPGISDVDLILEGERIEFPDPGPAARLFQGEDGVAVLVLTTPELVQALAVQEALEQRYDRPVDLQPTELGRRRDLYRVSIRAVGGRQEALAIASTLGSILEDPGS